MRVISEDYVRMSEPDGWRCVQAGCEPGTVGMHLAPRRSLFPPSKLTGRFGGSTGGITGRASVVTFPDQELEEPFADDGSDEVDLELMWTGKTVF